MQKFSLIVHDVTAETLPDILAKLNGTTAVTAVAQAAPVAQAPAAVVGAPAGINTAAVGGADVSSAPAVDADGIVWDARIHAGTRTQTKDGRWKRKSGIADDMFEAVKAELKASAPAPQAPAAAPSFGTQAPVAQTAPVAGAPSFGTQAPVNTPPSFGTQAPVAGAPQAAPVAQAAPVTANAVDPNDRSFNAFTQKMGRLYGGNHVTPTYTDELVARINNDWRPYGKQINTITDVASDEALLDYAWKILDVDGFGAV